MFTDPLHGRPPLAVPEKHINIFLTALAGQSSQGRSPARPRDKRDKMAILLWKSTENGCFVPGTGPGLSQGRIPLVPGTVPVCPEHRPAKSVYVCWVFLAREKGLSVIFGYKFENRCNPRTVSVVPILGLL